MHTHTASTDSHPAPSRTHGSIRLRERSTWSSTARLLIWVGSVTLVTLLPLLLHPSIQHTTAALLYTLVVLINAIVSGLWVGVGTSLLAFAALNYFFMTPYHAIGITSGEDAVHLGTFLCVAVIVSGLAGRSRDHAAHAMRHAAHLDALYRLSQAISAEVERERILPMISDTTRQLFNAQACHIALLDQAGMLVVYAQSGFLTSEETMGWRTELPIRHNSHEVGTLTLVHDEGSPSLSIAEHDVLHMIATQVALVLERAKLVETTHHASVLAEANHLKSILLSSVSHDFRTPLAVMKGAVSNLLDESVPWEPRMQHELLCSIDQEITRLDRLVSDLLVMSRIEAGALEQTRSWHEVPDLVEHVIMRLAPVLSHHRVIVDIPTELPPVFITYTHIDRVLTNLLENVVYHTPLGTVITVRANEQGDKLHIAVCDTGPGFPDTILPHVFEKFVRGGDSERHTEGSGLGLAICKGLVAVHGGTICASNRDEGGACVTFTLPREIGAETHAARPMLEEAV